MDKNLQTIIEKRIERTVKALNDNQFDAHFVKSKEEMFAKIDTFLPTGASCSVGGSMTLFETGVIDYLKAGDYNYLDRYAEGVDAQDIFHQAFGCDVYFTGSNAITENGWLHNMDGRGNRVAALTYGPKKVVVVAGYNKIVKDIEAARLRVREIAAPANVARLSCETPCLKTGYCVDCKVSGHTCSLELTCKYQMIGGRIAVLILPGHYGY